MIRFVWFTTIRAAAEIIATIAAISAGFRRAIPIPVNGHLSRAVPAPEWRPMCKRSQEVRRLNLGRGFGETVGSIAVSEKDAAGSKSIAGRRFVTNWATQIPSSNHQQCLCQRNGPSLGGRAGAVTPVRHAAGRGACINVGSQCPFLEAGSGSESRTGHLYSGPSVITFSISPASCLK